jgi:REP element-mobilizing transposase RayT
MRSELFVHAVWATWRRSWLIDESIEGPLHHAIGVKCLHHGCRVVAIGGTGDHVHLLVEIRPTVRTSRLVGEAKGFSSYLMTHEIAPRRFFRWQEGYGAKSVAPEDLAVVERYVRRQRIHHREQALRRELELP